MVAGGTTWMPSAVEVIATCMHLGVPCTRRTRCNYWQDICGGGSMVTSICGSALNTLPYLEGRENFLRVVVVDHLFTQTHFGEPNGPVPKVELPWINSYLLLFVWSTRRVTN